MVGTGCGCSWVLEQSSGGLTWLLVQRGKHSGHVPGDEESNTHLPLPAEWEHSAAAGVSVEGEDPAHTADYYLGILHKARLERDAARVYSDLAGVPLPGFSRSDPAGSPSGKFRARGGHHLYRGVSACTATAASAAAASAESSVCPPGRGTNAPYVCICGQPRDALFDGPVIRCTRARTCLRGGVFHLATLESPDGCVAQSELDIDNSYTCAPCKMEQDEEECTAGMELQEDAAVFEAPVADDSSSELAAEAGGATPGDKSAGTNVHRRLADARTARCLPTHATAFRSWCTPDEFSDLKAARARARRGGLRISAEYVPFLQK